MPLDPISQVETLLFEGGHDPIGLRKKMALLRFPPILMSGGAQSFVHTIGNLFGGGRIVGFFAEVVEATAEGSATARALTLEIGGNAVTGASISLSGATVDPAGIYRPSAVITAADDIGVSEVVEVVLAAQGGTPFASGVVRPLLLLEVN